VEKNKVRIRRSAGREISIFEGEGILRERDNDQGKLEGSKNQLNQLKIARFLLSRDLDPERRRELREKINKELEKIEGREVESNYLLDHTLSLKLLGIIRPLIRINQRVKGYSIFSNFKKLILSFFAGYLNLKEKERGGKDK